MGNKPLIVITGASSGIGKAVAIQFANNSYPCLLISRHISPLPELKNKEVMYAQVDVTNYSAFEKAIKEAEKKYGKTECIVNNAGVMTIGDISTMPIEKCDYELDVLIKGVLNGIKIVLPDMIARKSGTIFNISSIAESRPSDMALCYHTSKHAVHCISESLQIAEAKNNVRVMNIAPGLIKTNIHQNIGISFEEYSEKLGNPTFIMPEELASIIYFCWELPQRICIRDMVVMPTDCAY